MRKGDKILLFVILAILIVVSLQLLIPDSHSKIVVIRSDGAVVKRIPLTKNKTEEFGVESEEGHLTVEIKNGRVRVINSTCKDKLCVKEGWIEKTGESIICLPNRISISIVGEKGNGVDSITY